MIVFSRVRACQSLIHRHQPLAVASRPMPLGRASAEAYCRHHTRAVFTHRTISHAVLLTRM